MPGFYQQNLDLRTIGKAKTKRAKASDRSTALYFMLWSRFPRQFDKADS